MGVHRSIPANTVQEFVSYVKKNPGKFNYASGGSGSVSHLTPALFLKRAELDMTHIAYKGGAPAVADLLSGNVQMYFGNLSELQPHVGGGLIKIIGVSSERRALQLPLVPTIAESGFPGFEATNWYAFAAPAKTLPCAVAKPSNADIYARKVHDARRTPTKTDRTKAEIGQPRQAPTSERLRLGCGRRHQS
jgi:tripartite-type tricarboxylate transporter receptor subunit TctC